MPNSASRKIVLLTGATDGLGKAAAILLAEHEYHVFAAGRSAAKRAELDSLARERKLPLESLEMEVCEAESVRRAVDSVYTRAGTIDVLINNAGVSYVACVEDMPMEDWRRQFEINFFGVLRVTQSVMPGMRERRSGRIIMMSSASGLVTPPTQGAYSASKHALEGLSNALRHELYPFGIATVLIEPGYIVTGIQQAAIELAQPYMQKIENGPYARVYASAWAGSKRSRAKSRTTPEDCARTILQAVEAEHPKARYTVTPLATMVKWSKRLLPDSAIDRMIRRRYGIVREA